MKIHLTIAWPERGHKRKGPSEGKIWHNMPDSEQGKSPRHQGIF
jgi:hypothetical protein